MRDKRGCLCNGVIQVRYEELFAVWLFVIVFVIDSFKIDGDVVMGSLFEGSRTKRVQKTLSNDNTRITFWII